MDQKQEVCKTAITTKGQNWINVYDPDGSTKIKEKYGSFAHPLICLLDKDKWIVAKDVSVEN